MTENLFEHSRFPVPATYYLRSRFRGGLLLFVLAATTTFAFPAHSQVPCDFKGIGGRQAHP
jgi:hypothetical protein